MQAKRRGLAIKKAAPIPRGFPLVANRQYQISLPQYFHSHRRIYPKARNLNLEPSSIGIMMGTG
jgi:hypothetical protein